MANPSHKRIEETKANVLRRLRDEPWLLGVGVGQVGGVPGVVISVSPDGEHKAQNLLEGVRNTVPTRVQVIGSIRKRDSTGT